MTVPNLELYEYQGERILQTYAGKEVDPLNMSVEDVCLADIAHALSLICRYNGHVRDFYSVAQHSVLVSQCAAERGGADLITFIAARNLCFWGLLHDAAEAYLGDVVSPLKPCSYFLIDRYGEHRMESFKDAERRLERVIAEKFGLTQEMPLQVKIADVAVLLGECASFGHDHGWSTNVEPFGVPITPLPPKQAEELFLDTFSTLEDFYGEEN